MKSIMKFVTVLVFLINWISIPIQSQDETTIWKEFVKALKSNTFTIEQIRPYEFVSKELLMEGLKDMRDKASWEEWEVEPETFRVENKIHYLIPLTLNGHKTTYCFTFLIENDRWYYQHLEAIFIRLDKVSPPPTTRFPDLPENTKAWIRSEASWSRKVWLFNLLSELKGRDYAFSAIKDGDGFFLKVKTWVPFVHPRKAFILYLCWEEARLKGSRVTLKKLEDNEAVVRIWPHFSLLYSRSHIQTMIFLEDYRKIFETIWQDRAEKAGWKIEIQYKGDECLFLFSSKEPKHTKNERQGVSFPEA